MMFGLVNASSSLPEWQAVKMTFFAPCTGPTITMLDTSIQVFFPSLNFVHGGGRENCNKISKRMHCFKREMRSDTKI